MPQNAIKLTAETAPDMIKAVIVNIGNHYFGAVIDNVQDIIQRNPTTPVPLTDDKVIGLLNLRGHIVTEIDVARTLNIHYSPDFEKDGGYSIVINRNGEMYSLVFEGIGDVIDIPTDDVEKLPDTINSEWIEISRGVYRMEGRLVVLLDFDLLIKHITPESTAMV